MWVTKRIPKEYLDERIIKMLLFKRLTFNQLLIHHPIYNVKAGTETLPGLSRPGQTAIVYLVKIEI